MPEYENLTLFKQHELEDAFSGYEDNINDYIRIGEIFSVDEKSGTCSVRFLDGPGGRDKVTISMPISNTSGMFWMPMATETAVILGRRPAGVYEILAYMPRNYTNLVEFGEHMQLKQGEFILRSRGGATIVGTNDGTLTFYDGKLNKVILDADGNFRLRTSNGTTLSSSNVEVTFGKIGGSASSTGINFDTFIKLMTTDGFRIRVKGFSAPPIIDPTTGLPIIDPSTLTTQMELEMKIENFIPIFSFTMKDLTGLINLFTLSLSYTNPLLPINTTNLILRSANVVIGKNDVISMAIPNATLLTMAQCVAKNGDNIIPSAEMVAWMTAVTTAAKCPVIPPAVLGTVINTTSNLKVQP